jgi:hypothetical protein
VTLLETIIIYHQIQRYNAPNETRPKEGVLFPKITRADADKGLVSCVQFFFNYFFFKFGMEVGAEDISCICSERDTVLTLFFVFAQKERQL